MAMASLNVIALISGGKDSFFSILHCLANGHNVMALANLHPPAQPGHDHDHDHDVVEDLESFMYQTVGHAVIPLYEQVLGLPLYRQEILGGAIVKARDYGPAGSDDETESLLPLLRKVVAAHPDANAVSTGAILSDYQRTRVESVALRLGLTPLSYLWQWPSLPGHTEPSLLQDMAAVGQDSRIIKVASGAMDDSFLWQNVADPRTIARITKAAQRFGSAGDGAVLGEGGEFETLAISGPAPLWKGRIEVKPENVTVVPGEAGSCSVRIKDPIVVPSSDQPAPPHLPRPQELDRQFELIRKQLESSEATSLTTLPSSQCESETAENILVLSEVTGIGPDVAGQTTSIMAKIELQLRERNRTLDHVACTIVTLRDMNDFTVINPIYGSYFKRPNPPARTTIACADVLPENAFLSITMATTPDTREGLHVQSRSYWAPANIGPYSQAIRTTSAEQDSSICIAGQIPLIPASMQLPSSTSEPTTDFIRHSVLALQHMHRIGIVMKVKQWTIGIAFLATSGVDEATLQQRAKIVRQTWEAYHKPTAAESTENGEESNDFDVWHLQHGSGKASWQINRSQETEEATPISDVPYLAVVTADSLPRGAEVEWVGHGKGSTGHQSCAPAHLASLLKTFQAHILRA